MRAHLPASTLIPPPLTVSTSGISLIGTSFSVHAIKSRMPVTAVRTCTYYVTEGG